ncbi:MAG: ElyC/SanA/YdcF family protein [Bacilli bacterium]|nr:ElyC/SanA/YdcF family protein [Bacilli bacterium]MDD4734388.1 ElyC/SanA/YdcF family protein [Bacilli bacterium]
MLKKIFKTLIIIILIIFFSAFSINLYVKLSTQNKILNEEEALKLKDVDCILVLGASVRGNLPSPMLEDRLLSSIFLYDKKVASKIIMSGDNGTNNYDEVNVMKRYAVNKGINSSDVFMDHAGFSTYDSIYRAKEIFNIEKMIIVTQKYHLYRALYIASQLGIEAYGVEALENNYMGQLPREVREILARNKDFFKSIIKPKPTYLGDVIPINGDGNITNDKYDF